MTEMNLLTQINLRIAGLNIDIDCCNLVIFFVVCEM